MRVFQSRGSGNAKQRRRARRVHKREEYRAKLAAARALAAKKAGP